MARNPYLDIDPLSFEIRQLGAFGPKTVFVVKLSDHGALDACMFRAHLSRFLLDELEGDFHLGNDRLPNLGNDLGLEITEAFDVQRLRDTFTVV